MKKHLLETIKDLRNNKGLKLREISEIVGCSGKYISRIIREDPDYNPYLYNNLKLNLKLKQIKHLRINENLTFTEIDKVLNLPPSSASRIFRNDRHYTPYFRKSPTRLNKETKQILRANKKQEIKTRNQNIKIDKKNGLTCKQLVEKYKLSLGHIHKLVN